MYVCCVGGIWQRPVHLQQSEGEHWEKKSEWEQKARSWKEECSFSSKIGILGGFLSSRGPISLKLNKIPLAADQRMDYAWDKDGDREAREEATGIVQVRGIVA